MPRHRALLELLELRLAEVQPHPLLFQHPLFILGQDPICERVLDRLQHLLALLMQLIGKSGSQNARRQRDDAYPKDREHHGKGLTDGRDRRDISVAHARQRNDSPIHRTRHGVELLRLHGMLELVDDSSGEDRNQDRDEHRCRERSFLTLQNQRKCR